MSIMGTRRRAELAPGLHVERYQAHYLDQTFDEAAANIKEAMLDFLDRVVDASSSIQALWIFDKVFPGVQRQFVNVEKN